MSKKNQFIILFGIIIMNVIFHCNGKNIILLIADDLDSVLDGMTPMKMTNTLIKDEGTSFDNCFAAVPICCPNRASILTGRYQHNHKVWNNSLSGNCNGNDWQANHEPNTFAAILKSQMKYKTFYAGKYLNQYGSQKAGGLRVPVGWDQWYGLVGNSKYYNYSLSINGREQKYADGSQNYLTDVIGGFAEKFIKSQKKGQPFLMVLAPPAPHEPFLPAPRHHGRFAQVKAKRTPNFNTDYQGDKHWLVRLGQSPLPEEVIAELDDIYRRRWESLLAVDEMLERVYRKLEGQGLLEETYIIFTSDNGFHIGQFSLPYDKRMPYETDIKVPLYIRGPLLEKGGRVGAAVSSVDIFATIMELAGLERNSDGFSLLGMLERKIRDRTVLVEYKGERRAAEEPGSGCPSADNDPDLSHCHKEFACKCQDSANNTFVCVRRASQDINNVFCLFDDDEKFVESYDLKKDENQLENAGPEMRSSTRHRFRKRVRKMSICKDRTCLAIGTQPKNPPSFRIA